jgi:hypothetical protein
MVLKLDGDIDTQSIDALVFFGAGDERYVP